MKGVLVFTILQVSVIAVLWQKEATLENNISL